MTQPENRRSPLGSRSGNERKQVRGTTSSAETPLSLRTSGTALDEETTLHVSKRLGRELGKHALHIERVTVRFKDVNGPRGGIDQTCAIKVVLSGLSTIVTTATAAVPREAFDQAAQQAGRAVKRVLQRAERNEPDSKRGSTSSGTEQAESPITANAKTSLIGRREGRAAVNLERALDRPEKRRRDVPVDTAAPGVSASDRRAGGGSSARRNTKKNTAGMTATLEDSATGKPSRKSTRRSANRTKQATALTRRQTARATSGKARATARGAAGGRKGRGKHDGQR